MDNIFASLIGIDEINKALSQKIVDKAVLRTVKSDAKKLITHSTKKVREEYNISAKELKSYTKQTRPTTSNPNIETTISSRTLSLANFAPRVKKVRTKRGFRKGVTVKVKKKTKRRRVTGAFLFNNEIYGRENTSAYPLKFKTTLSAPQMYNEKIMKKTIKVVQEKQAQTFAHNLDFYLSRM